MLLVTEDEDFNTPVLSSISNLQLEVVLLHHKDFQTLVELSPDQLHAWAQRMLSNVVPQEQ
jgi:hypothetical protein